MPALAFRQAAPWLNLKRCTRHGPRRLSLGLVLLLFDQTEPVKRTHHLADRAGGHTRVKRCRVEPGMAQEHTDIDILLQKTGRMDTRFSISPAELPCDRRGSTGVLVMG